jgi:hypothetical protein
MARDRRTATRIAESRLAACLLCWLMSACSGSPTQPRETLLTIGRWTGGGACLTIAQDACDLTAGCGHGQFPRPIVHADGTFEVDGTYRIEIGPIGITPAPPAHFSGLVDGSTLLLTVVPSGNAPSPVSYTMRPTTQAGCPLCL